MTERVKFRSIIGNRPQHLKGGKMVERETTYSYELNAWIGVGANLGNPKKTVPAAIRRLNEQAQVNVQKSSSLYQTKPISSISQPDFINAVVRVRTSLDPMELLNVLLKVESEFGRIRDDSVDGPRVLDMDLLIYSDLILDLPELSVPHPRLTERLFVLKPLREIESSIKLPGLGSIDQYMHACRDQKVKKVSDGR
ncbi:MAG: 2-amino-4-hydroxy-6-hydroxymethyldihydropteridine diphosphokinase [Acidiferrobacteraceae bacterium]|nr:2-amino-4-hydroxy-6-hydroxymethyldihydropteridine diphosphokinase [Acidiferrobacteraceae bacterium]